MFTNRSIRIIAVSSALLSLTACIDPEERDNAPSSLIVPPMMNTRPATFACSDSGNVVVRPIGEDGRGVILAFTDREVQLKSVPAPEGRKYSDGKTLFWVNGANATLLREGREQPETCEQK